MIGISTSVMNQKLPKTITEKRYHLSMDYVTSVRLADGMPVMLPTLYPKDAEAVMEDLSGLIISGGVDLAAVFSDETPKDKIDWWEQTDLTSSYARDLYEIALVREAIRQKKPFFGICRGAQVLNVAFGGTLYQEINEGYPHQHIQFDYLPSAPSHEVTLKPGSLLQEIFQKDKLAVNSYHHQAIHKVGTDLRVSALSEDGWIEGVDYLGASLAFGVQWHPEIMAPENPEMLKLFQYFVAATKKL